MSNTWKFNGREIDPDKLPTRDDVFSRLLASGGANADHAILIGWDYGPNGGGLTYHARFTGGDGGYYLLPVREGVLRVPYGSQSDLEPNNSDELDLRHAELVTQEEAWDTMDFCFGFEPAEAKLWGEIAMIAGEMNLHDPED